MTELLHDPQLIIDDLGYRVAGLEKIALVAVEQMQAIAGRPDATVDQLRKALQDLRDDTCNSLMELQTCAVERLSLPGPASAQILKFSPRAGETQPAEVVS